MKLGPVHSSWIAPCLLFLFLLIQRGHSQADDAPRITKAPENQKVVEDGIVSFFCKASGNPAPDLHWRKNGRRISANRQRYMVVDMPHGSVLRIEPVKSKRDDAMFECVADNGIGEPAVASARLETYPTGELPSGYPRIVDAPTLKAVEKDRNTVMMCNAQGIPEPNIYWLKDFIPVDFTDPRLKQLPGGSLQIRLSQESDEGKYECVAENDAGVAYSYGANLYVRVRRVPPHFSIPPESVEVMPGGDVNITCVAVGSPMPYVKWRLGAVELTPEDNIPIGKNVLMLTSVTQSDNYTCVAASDLGNIEAVAQVKVKALPKPPTSLVISDVTASTVKLSWNSGNTEPIESYLIQYKRKYTPGLYEEISQVPSEEYTVRGLDAYTVYEFRVLANNNIGRGIPSIAVDVTTGELAPGTPPRNVRARPVSSSTIVVQWDEPKTPNGVIRGYKVYFTMTPDLPITLWTLHQVDNSELTTISNLLTNRTYTISVLAYTSVGDGPLSDPMQVKTQQGVLGVEGIFDIGPVPEQPTNLQGEPVSPNAIQLTWDPPETSGETVQSYELYYNDSHFRQNVRITISPPRNTYLLEDLTPNTVYHIRVTAKSMRGEGASSPTIQVRTKEYVPGEPRKVKAEVINSTAVHVSWRPPMEKERNGIIRGYQIHYFKVNERNDPVGLPLMYNVRGSEKNEVAVTGLQPDTLYQFQVAGYTRRGDGERSRPVKVKTKGAVPTAPRGLQLQLVQDDPPVVSAQWQAPRNPYGSLAGYKLTFGRQGEPSVQERRFEATKYRYTTGFLDKGTTYEFRISAKNAVDFGEQEVKIIRTPDGIPGGAPRNFSYVAMSPTSVKLAWDRPDRSLRNGEIVMYEIMYHKQSDPVSAFDVNTTNSQLIIEGLEMSTDYIFQIKAYTSKGAGPWSNRLFVHTFGQSVPPAPYNVRLRRISPTAIEVSWNAQTYAGITGYRVYYNMFAVPDMDQWQSVEIGPYTVTEINGLEPHTVYAVRVRARGQDGRYGNYSDIIATNNLAQASPDMVQEFHARTQNPRSVMLEWKPPRKPGVVKYVIKFEGSKTYRNEFNQEIMLHGEKKTEILPKEERTLYIDELVPHTVYSFNISSRFMDGTLGPDFHIRVQTSIDDY